MEMGLSHLAFLEVMRQSVSRTILPQMKTRIPLRFVSFLLIVVLTSCGEKLVKTYNITDAALRVEGPLYDGPNTLQAIHRINLQTIDPELTAEKIESVILKRAVIRTEDSLGFDRVRNFVLQITSENAKMQKAAALNPVAKGKYEVELSPAVDAELAENFWQPEVILILDADIQGDWEENIEYSGSFEFDITFKK